MFVAILVTMRKHLKHSRIHYVYITIIILCQYPLIVLYRINQIYNVVLT